MSGKPRDWNRDPLPECDQQYKLCQLTQLSTPQILGIMADARGQTDEIVQTLRIRKQSLYVDDGRWNTYRAWIKMYVPQWEGRFKKTMSDALTVTEQEQFQAMMSAAAKALNIDEALLIHYAVNQQAIQAFLDLQRHTLGTMAEAKLWELVAAGDAPTIRWLLPRIKQPIYGEQPAEKTDTTRSIRIIDAE